MRQFPLLYENRPPEDGVDLKTLAAIADAHAFEVWGGEAARDEPFPVVDATDSVFAFVFPYALGAPTFPTGVSPDIYQPDQAGRYGSIYVAARRTAHPVLRVVHALHPLFVRGEEAQRHGRAMLSADVQLNRIYWVGFHQEYFEVSAGDQRVMMDVRSLKQVSPESVLQGKVSSGRDERINYWKPAAPEAIPAKRAGADEKAFEDVVKNLIVPTPAANEVGGNPLATSFKLVPLADCVPAVNWTWWCVPTAFTMATCYYDNYNKAVGGITGYGRLVGYWFDHPKSGHNVPDFIDQLIDPKTGTWRSGFSGFQDFIMKNYGYSFTTHDVAATAANDWAWKEITAEIDSGRPFVWGVPDHATCAFGYRIATSGKFVVLHTTWGDSSTAQREEWPYTKGTGLTAIIPGGGATGQNLEVWSPDGGETLLTNVATTIRWHIWGNQIKSAEVLVSTDGGNTWTAIAKAAPCVPGWNDYDWTPNAVTERARVRVRGLDAKGAYVAGDGSQTNIKVLPGPRPVTLKTFLVKAQTDATGAFSAPHGLERFTPDGFSIRAISIAVRHANGNWHTLELSHNVDNRFWWNQNSVAGVMASPNFFLRPVQVVIFAEAVVG
ncbi:MAG: hypothetical protein WAL90_05305 [Desulfobacterales bacterium]